MTNAEFYLLTMKWKWAALPGVLNTLMKNLDQQVYQIDLLVLHKTGTLLQDIPEGVHVIEGASFFNAVDSPLKELLKKGDLPHLFSKRACCCT